MASWLDAFVQGREYGNKSTLGGLEAGSTGQYRMESEQGQRRRAYEANRLTAADMGLRRNIAQTQLNYDAQVDSEIAERERKKIELEASRNAAINAQAALQNRFNQMQIAKEESMNNLMTSLFDPRASASDVIGAIPHIGLENLERAKPQIAEFLSSKVPSDVLVRQGNAYRFIKPESGVVNIDGQMYDADHLESVFRALGIEAGMLQLGGMDVRRSQNSQPGFWGSVFGLGEPTEGGMRGQ